MNRKSPGELYDAATGERLYTVRDAAKLLSYHPFSVYRLVFLGKLRHRRLGPKTLLFSREDLLRYRSRFEEDRPRRGSPMPDAEPSGLSAEVQVELGGETATGRFKQFRWENVPLIRARLDSQYGRRLRGLRISVRGGEGDAWKLVYQAPRV